MSGGHFGYDQHKIEDIACEIEQLISTNDSTEKDKYGYPKGRRYAPEIINHFREAAITLRRAGIMANRIDYLVSDDDGPESFIRRWDEELSELNCQLSKSEREG